MSHDEYQEVLEDVLRYSRERGYTGYDKHDGMSSPVIQRFPFDNQWINLCVQETIKRAPINLRPIFAVERRQSPVGLSLFTLANRRMYDLTNEVRYIRDAEFLINRVQEFGKKSTDTGFALPHNHELQRIGKTIPRGTPRVVATTWGVEALLRMADRDNSYSELAHSVTKFVEDQLAPTSTDKGIKVKYKPTDNTDHYTINANAVTARMYSDLYMNSPSESYERYARGILQYVSNCQEPNGGWYYRDPPSSSHLSMDNYHNGYIIESFQNYGEVFDDEFEPVVETALSFYRDRLFEETGAPNWDENSSYPKDIAAVAQGVVVFAKAGKLEFARRILDWALANLYAGEGRFYYQQRWYYTKRFTLMRWCQAWMVHAISTFLQEHYPDNPG